MPILTVNTNVESTQVQSDFKTLFTYELAKTLGKPVSYIAVHLNTSQDISFGGTDEPSALCELVSIGGLSVELNKRHSKVIMDLLKKHLKVPPTRVYISFRNVDKADVGFDRTTFDDTI